MQELKENDDADSNEDSENLPSEAGRRKQHYAVAIETVEQLKKLEEI